MKKLFIVLISFCLALSAKSQAVPGDTAALRAFINMYITSNGNKQITGTQLNKLFNGIANLMKSYAVDSAWIHGDTLGLVRRGFTTIKLVLPSATGGIESDPTVSAAAKTITSLDIAAWFAKQDPITTGKGVYFDGTNLRTRNDSALWNAAKLMGITLANTSPAVGQVLKFDGTNATWATDSTSDVGATGTDLSTSTSITTATINSSTGTDAIIPAANGIVSGLLTQALYNIFNAKIGPSDTGNLALPYRTQIEKHKDSLAAHNIRLMSLLADKVPATRTLTINGTTYDLSANRSWTISGGGSAILDTIATYISGSTYTIPNSTNIIVINPSTEISSLVITMPATAHVSNEVQIYFGGTITSGNVITSIDFAANSGQTLLVDFSASAVETNEYISFKKIGTVWYRKN